MPTAEQYLVSRLTKKAAAARLGAELLKKIEADSRLDDVTRKSLLVALPRLCAKYLNKSGISAEYKDEVVVAICCLRIVQRQFRLEAKLDELIATMKPRDAGDPTNKEKEK